MDDAVAETVAAIALHFGLSPIWHEASEASIRSVEGFPGFYRLAIDAGTILDRVSKGEDIKWGDAADWLQTIENYAERILVWMRNNKDRPNLEILETLAKESIYYYMEPKFPSPMTPQELQLTRDLLVTAFEGGSNYWYTIETKKTVYPPGTEKADFKEGGKAQTPGNYYHWSQLIPTIPGGALIIMDKLGEGEDAEAEYRLDLPALQKAWSVLKHKYPKRYKNIMNEDYDAEDGDIFLQSAIFGEAIYG